jgi:hypothetical protein
MVQYWSHEAKHAFPLNFVKTAVALKPLSIFREHSLFSIFFCYVILVV